MEAFAAFTALASLVSIVAGIIVFVAVILIAVNCSRSAKRLNIIIELIRGQNAILGGISRALTAPPVIPE